MSQAPTGASGLVRVTVASGTRRVDLVLPGALPVAELVPELARSVGLLDSTTVHGGYRVVSQDGRELVPDAGLTVQGIEDGGLLTVTAGVDDAPVRVYDDVVEAMVDVVEQDLEPWEPARGRRTALNAAGLLLALGAVALLIQRGALLPAVAACVVAVLLAVGGVVLSRVQDEPQAAVALAWMAAGYAGVGGLLLVTDGPLLGLPFAAAGGGVLLVGVLAVLGLGDGRALTLPLVIVGAITGLSGVVVHAADLDQAVVLLCVLAAVVVAGSVLPWLALGLTGTRVQQVHTVADISADPEPIDPDRVGSDARIAHEVLVGVTTTVGLLLVLVAPMAVSLGLFGTLVAVMCCVIVMLRTRQYRTGLEVFVGLASGVLGLASIAAAVLWLHPDWRPAAAVVLAAAGAVLMALTLVPSQPSVRRGRLGDVAETTALVSLLPLLLVAVGVFGAVRG